MGQETHLVTGATRGMGMHIATHLALRGKHVLLVARDRARGEEVRRNIQQVAGHSGVDLLVADLSSQKQIHRLAEEVTSRYQKLDGLINNAGAHIQTFQRSEDGFEMNLAVNHLASFLLTRLLLPQLKKAPSARIVQVASRSMASKVQVKDIQQPERFHPWKAYRQAKLWVVMCSYHLARGLNGTRVTVNTLHPGLVATDMARDAAPRVLHPLLPLFGRLMRSPEEGARAVLHLALAAELAGVSGQYFHRTRSRRSVQVSLDEGLQQQVWDLSMQWTGGQE